MCNKRLCSLVYVMAILGSILAPWPASVAADGEFAGGEGTAEDPYQISDWDHLDNVRDHLGACFILLNDLDRYTAGYTTGGWLPIGTEARRFKGSFDGQGYEIADLVIDRTADYIGFFGYIDSGAEVEGITVTDCDVTGSAGVGGLVGWNDGMVSSCCATGTVNGSGDCVGGLAGWNDGTVSNCYATGTVSGAWYVGGLVGRNAATMSNCYATGSVTGDGYVGGLVGDNDGTVSQCYATGSVNGSGEYIGGLLGLSFGTVSNCYATGSVNGPGYFVGGLVGYRGGTVVSNCFWDTDTSDTTSSAGGTGKTTEEMRDIATYREQGTTGLTWPWDILSVADGATLPYATWNIVDGEGYPFLTFRQGQVEVKTGWNMVSVPGGLADSANTVEEVFGDQIEAIYYWNPGDPGSYNVPTVVEPTKGYWVAVTEDKTLTLRI